MVTREARIETRSAVFVVVVHQATNRVVRSLAPYGRHTIGMTVDQLVRRGASVIYL